MRVISGREAAVGVVVFALLVVVSLAWPAMTTPAAAALVCLVLLMSERSRLEHVRQRIDSVAQAVRDADTGIMSLEQAHEPIRLLGAAIDARWNRGTITPDVANYLIQQILFRRPDRILECGAGVSTRVIARTLRTLGTGRLVTLEHDPHWAAEIRRILHAEGLSGFVEVVEAPLVPQPVQGGRELMWYRCDLTLYGAPFDLVFVDGPPWAQPEHPGREAALYTIAPFMRPGALLLLDDANREGEQAAIKRWSADFGGAIRHELLPLRKGLWAMELVAEGHDRTLTTAVPSAEHAASTGARASRAAGVQSRDQDAR